MPLPLPSLDSRTYAELVAEGKAMIPRFAPAWTDHNVHDPGITLIELFAWLAEMDIYRLDRTTDESRRAFPRLIGVELPRMQIEYAAADVVLEALDAALQQPGR